MPDKHSRSFRLAYAIILLLAWSTISSAPAETLPLKHFTTSDGLAHDRVNRIVRDSRGLLWFCTAEGLSRFDGYQFKNYTRDEGMPHRSITDFLELPDGRYWVATGDGLVLFNPQGLARRWRGFENNSTTADESLMFRVFRPGELNPGTNRWSVTRLQMGNMGTLWALTSSGLYRVGKEGGQWQLSIVEKQEWHGKTDFDTIMRTGADRRAMFQNQSTSRRLTIPDACVPKTSHVLFSSNAVKHARGMRTVARGMRTVARGVRTEPLCDKRSRSK